MFAGGEATAMHRGGDIDATPGRLAGSTGAIWQGIAEGRAVKILHFQLNERQDLGGIRTSAFNANRTAKESKTLALVSY